MIETMAKWLQGSGSEVVTITPELAGEMLERLNKRNRRMVSANCDFLEAAMQSGHFNNDYTPIRISVSGTLLDGQHRLSACVKSGVSIEQLVVWGIADDAFNTIDSNLVRRPRDLLHLHGLDWDVARIVPGVINSLRLVRAWERGAISGGSAPRLSMDDTLHFLSENPSAPDRIRMVTKLKPPGLSVAMTVAGLWGAFGSHPSLVLQFLEQVAIGTDLTKTDPAWHLRSRLIADSIQRTAKLSLYYRCALLIKAFNAFASQQTVTALRFNTTGNAREEFPVALRKPPVDQAKS